MKDGAVLGYSHGFTIIVEVGEQIRKVITGDGSAEVSGHRSARRAQTWFGVPTLIAVHPENDPKGEGTAIGEACQATGGHRGRTGIFLFRCGK